MGILFVINQEAGLDDFLSSYEVRQISADCVITSSIGEAEGVLAQRPFDLIFADCHLPDGAGIALLEAAGGAPLVIMAAAGQETAVLQAMQAGAADYLIKDAGNGYRTLLPLVAKRVMRARAERPFLAQFADQQQELYILKQAIDNSSVSITLVDAQQPEMVLIYVNAAFEKLTGYSASEVIGKNCRFLRGEDHDQEGVEQLRQAVQKGESATAVVRNYRKDGSMFWNDVSISAIYNRQGQLTHYMGVQKDVTRRKELEETLHLNERRLRALLTAIPDLVFRIHQNGIFLDFFATNADSLALPPEQFLGRTLSEAMPPTVAAQTMVHIEKALQTGEEAAFEYELEIDGQLRDFEARIMQFSQDDVLTIVREITERRQTAQALYASEEKYRSLVESSDAAIAMLAADGKVLYANSITAQLLGKEPADIIGKQVGDVFPPEVAAPQLAYMREVIGSGEGQVIEAPAILLGQRNWYRNSVQPVRDGSGRITAVLINAVNITPLKQAETALRDSEEKLQALINSQTNYVLRTDLQGKHTYWNKKFAEDFAIVYGGEETLMQADALVSICDYHHPRTIETVEKCLAQPGVVFQVELDKPSKGGSIQTTFWEFICLTDRNGLPHEIQCVGINITALKQTETKLRESEERYRQMFEMHGLPKLIIDPQAGQIRDANLAASFFYGYSLAQMKELTIFDLTLSPQENILATIAEASASPTMLPCELQQIGTDGQIRDVELFGGMMKIKGRPHFYAIITDVTEKNQAKTDLEEAHRLLEERVNARTAELAKSELRYRSLFNQSNDAVFLLDTSGKHLQVNQRAADLLGYTPEEIVGLSSRDLIVPEEHPESAAIVQRLFAREKIPIYLRTFRHKNGRAIPVEVNVEMVWDEDGEPLHIQSIVRDIAERRAAEMALRESEERYRTTISSISEGIVLQGIDGKIQLCNAAAERILGLTAEQMMGRTSIDPRWAAVHEDGSPFPGETHPAMVTLRTGEPLTDVVMGVHKPDGSLTWISINSRPIVEMEGGEATAVVTTFTDISERRQMIESLRQSEQRLELAARAGGIGVWDWDVQNDTHLWDERMFALYGMDPAQTKAGYNTWVNALHPDDLNQAIAQIEAALQGHKPYNLEFRIIWPDDSVKYLLGLASVLRDAAGTPLRMVGINMDITSRKESEETLRSALEKERELGELKTRFVSMTSHEFRTPLATILATTETLTIYRNRMDETQIDARLDKIRQQVNHLKLMMDDVLQLARIQAERMPFNPKEDDLDGLCHEIIEEYHSQQANRGRINYTPAQTHLTAYFDRQLMRQAIGNLVSNALKYSANDQLVFVTLEVEDEQIKLSVKDNGIGIPQKDLAHMYDPFHRAGNVGVISGTGLGLPITKRAVEMHGGEISVMSETDKGTTFVITMPQNPTSPR
jgi:PAS domain S-box-containing protein